MGDGVVRTSVRLALAITLCTLHAPQVAHALEDYADDIADELDLADKPSCHYCHARRSDDMATDTPFCDALKSRGFARRMGTPSLLKALARLDDDGTDSDGDGVPDVDELRSYANPNDPDDRGRPPQSCQVAWGHPPYAPWLGVTLLFGSRLALRRARRRGGSAG